MSSLELPPPVRFSKPPCNVKGEGSPSPYPALGGYLPARQAVFTTSPTAFSMGCIFFTLVRVGYLVNNSHWN